MAESEDRYRILLECASDGIVSLNSRGKIIEFNKKAEEIYHYTKDEVIGKSLSIIIPKYSFSTHRQGLTHIVDTHASRFGKTMEVAGVRKDGTEIPHEISISTFTVGDEPVFTAIIRDITERKKAERKIKRQNEELILLNSIAKIIGQSINLKEILTSVLGFVMDTSKARIGAVFLPKGSKLSLEACKVLLTKNLLKKKVKEINLDDNVVGYAVQKGEIIISGNGRSKGHKVPGIVAHPSKIKTFICLPLKSKDKVVGVLFIGDFEEIRFTQKDQDLLKSIGNTIGVSIENAMLFEEIKAANLEIEQERGKLEHLTKKLIVSQEDERRIISRELHDEAGQLLSTLKINLEMIKKNLPGNLKDISTLIKKSTQLVDQSSREIKRLCTNLHPSVLDSLGLHAALSSQVDDFQRASEVKTEFNYGEVKERYPIEIERVIYRIVQESLNNIAKHARASRLSVSILDTHKSIIVTVDDNGIGFDVQKTLSSQDVKRGLGLLGIKERASLVNGRVSISSKRGKGTVIRLEIPKKIQGD